MKHPASTKIILNISLIALIITCTQCHLPAQSTVTWAYYDWQINLGSGMEIGNNDAESLSILGNGIEISIFQFDRPDDDEMTLQQFAAFLGRLFRLEEPDPIHPFKSEYLNAYCIAGYKEFDRIVTIVFEEDEYRFFATATFDDDNLEAEELALTLLRSIRKVE
jgi:hypothetical protein